MTSVLHFQKLDVYRCSIEFLGVLHAHVARMPKGHAELVDQLRRASQSIPLNIAEGVGRRSPADKGRHFTIARGSAMECAAIFDVLKLGELVDEPTYNASTELLERIVAMLTKLIDL